MNNLITLCKGFSYSDEMAEFVSDWDVELLQLETGTMTSNLKMIATSNVILQEVCFEKPVHQIGAAPADAFTVAFFLQGKQDNLQWCSRTAYERDFLLFPSTQEWDSISLNGFKGHTLSFSRDSLESLYGIFTEEEINKAIHISPSIVQNRNNRFNAIQNTLIESFNNIEATYTDPNRLESYLEQGLLIDLLHSINLAPDSRECHINSLQREQIRKAALAYIHESINEKITVKSLCQNVNTSLSTLERVFNSTYGMGPKQYINNRKLHHLHRKLINAAPDQTITEIASELGYWHMGQLTRDYKKLFNCLPRESLQRSA